MKLVGIYMIQFNKKLGPGCASANLIGLEYRWDNETEYPSPVAFMVYKHWHESRVTYSTNREAEYFLYIIIANKMDIPYFEVRYSDDLSQFLIYGENFAADHCIEMFNKKMNRFDDVEDGLFLTAVQYVKFHHWLRRLPEPSSEEAIEWLRKEVASPRLVSMQP